MLYPKPQAVREYTATTWKNDNSFPQTVTLDGVRYTWKPGESKDISSQYDDAIHRVSGAEELPDGTKRGGAIVGGLAPRLTKVNVDHADRAVLHESLDADLLARRSAEAAAIEAQKEVETAQTNAILAQAKADKAKPQADQSAKSK
jgi:hypothetical protein